MITALISLIFIAGIVIFFIGTAAVVFHFFHYRIEKGHHQTIMVVFAIGALILICAEFIVFSSIRWEAINDFFVHYKESRGL